MDEQQLAESLKRSRRTARRLLSEAFGVSEPGLAALLEAAAADLGTERLERCVALVAAGPLSGRRDRLAALAELAVATRTLGWAWWQEPLMSPDGQEVLEGAPDGFLESGLPLSEGVYRRSGVLGWLAVRAADAVAVIEMGPPAAWADLNSMSGYSYPLVVDAQPGERVSVSYDAGARCDGVVEATSDGRLHARLDLDSCRHVLCSEVGWAWGVLAPLADWLLPGETPDPYAQAVDQETADVLRRWAKDRAADVSGLDVAWQTAGDVLAGTGAVRALSRVPGGWWLTWELAALAVADGDVGTARDLVGELLTAAPLQGDPGSDSTSGGDLP